MTLKFIPPSLAMVLLLGCPSDPISGPDTGVVTDTGSAGGALSCNSYRLCTNYEGLVPLVDDAPLASVGGEIGDGVFRSVSDRIGAAVFVFAGNQYMNVTSGAASIGTWSAADGILTLRQTNFCDEDGSVRDTTSTDTHRFLFEGGVLRVQDPSPSTVVREYRLHTGALCETNAEFGCSGTCSCSEARNESSLSCD